MESISPITRSPVRARLEICRVRIVGCSCILNSTRHCVRDSLNESAMLFKASSASHGM